MRSGVSQGAPDGAGPNEDVSASFGGDQGAPGSPNRAGPDEGTGAVSGENQAVLMEECHHLCWGLEREVPHCYVRLLRGSKGTIPIVVIDS